MFGYRTPVKENKTGNKDPAKSPTGQNTMTSTVRRSVELGEAGKPDQKRSPIHTKTQTPPPTAPTASTSAVASAATSTAASVVVSGSPSIPETQQPKDRLTEARICLAKIKAQIATSRNTKTEIKTEVIRASERLYQLVKEAESKNVQKIDPLKRIKEKEVDMDGGAEVVEENKREKESVKLIKKLEEHANLIKESTETMNALKGKMESIQMNAAEIKEQKHAGHENTKLLIENGRRINELKEVMEKEIANISTYAQVAARPTPIAPGALRKGLHSIIVTSPNLDDTSDAVIKKIRTAVDAKTTGVRVDYLRKAKNQSVIISCTGKEELERVSTRIRDSSTELKVEETVNRNPLVIVRDVMSYVSDEDVVTAIGSQNGHLLEGIKMSADDIHVKYRRRARNPLVNHIVLQVPPLVWQRLTSAGRIHVDLQRVIVQDQSPLIQCTKCLAYGHGKKSCIQPAVLCSHCGEPHTRAECHAFTLGEEPKCRNCTLAKREGKHNAFDRECPVKTKWDALARSAVAYC